MERKKDDSSINLSDSLVILLASYGAIELIETELYGPFGVLEYIKLLFEKLAGKYCGYCLIFWLGLLFSIMPKPVTSSVACVGFKFIVDELIYKESEDE